jgi:hypothetical protein
MLNKTLLEKKNKPRKRIYNPYQNDEEYDTVNENQSIKEKSKNPFWVPHKNAEVFEVRDILRQEKEKKRLINRYKHNQRGKDKESFERNFDVNSVKNEQKSLYLTEQKFPEIRNRKKNFSSNRINTYNESKTESDYLDTFSNNTGNVNTIGTKILEKIKEKKDKEKIDELEKNLSDKLQDKVYMMSNRGKDSVRDYINKTREIILTKYTTEIKKERAIRLKETYQNEIESIKDSITSMQKAKHLFEEEFFLKFERYVKYLQFQKEKEKNELNNLLDNKNKIEIEVVKLENKIMKQKEKLMQYSEYRDFLICIKERRIRLPDFFIKITELNFHNASKETYNGLPTENSKNNLANKQGKITKTTFQTANIFNNNNNSNSQPSLAEIERYNDYLTKNIFESAEELNEEIKKMEFENINLLEKLNHTRATVDELKTELNKREEEEKRNNEYVCKDIIIREKYFNDLKEMNAKLLEEKNNVSNDRVFSSTASQNLNAHKKISSMINFFNKNKKTSNMSYTKTKFNQNMIYSKINSIYQCCLDLKINKQSNLNKDNISTLKMLKVMERSMDYLLEEQKYYLTDPDKKLEWEKKKSELDKERKIKKAKELKNFEEMKRDQLKKNINERNNRLLVIPRKKVAERFKPIDHHNSKNNDKKNDDEPTLADLLYN